MSFFFSLAALFIVLHVTSQASCHELRTARTQVKHPNNLFINALTALFRQAATQTQLSQKTVRQSKGFNLDRCKTDSDCQGSRRCYYADGTNCNGNSACVCVPVDDFGPQFEDCLDSDYPCVGGETCVTSLDDYAEGRCVSESALPPLGGLTLERCRSSSDCAGDRRCYTYDTEDDLVTECIGVDPEVLCLCLPASGGRISPRECSRDSDCDDAGEGCVRVLAFSYCAARRVVGAPSGPAEDICIDANALSGFGREEMVYAEDRMANVLCDGNGSCATAGHMVMFEGRAMRMSSYCLVAKCGRRRMLVNSPKYRRAMRIKSRTEGLEFTAFAARYNTWAEEVALRTAVRVGL